MGPVDLLWHLLNLFAVPVLFGLIAAAGAKLLWRRRLSGVSSARLATTGSAAAAASALVGLVSFGRDGRMVTYGLMIVAAALALIWAGRRRR